MLKSSRFFLTLAILCASACTVPDLREPATFEEAKKKAIPLSRLERKLMYGMIQLYVDENGNPYTGWTLERASPGKHSSLGYLKRGRREGLWITTDENRTKVSEIEWKEDRMQGSFVFWHSNGALGVVGQTTDGEVDGEWTEYYSNGQMACRSINRIGHLVSMSVWQPDGTPCLESNVTDGNGSFLRYFENGKVEHRRLFTAGVETKREISDQR